MVRISPNKTDENLKPLNPSQLLKNGISELQLNLSSAVQSSLMTYVELMDKWNKIHNLTAIRDVHSILIRHIFDSLAIAAFIRGPNILDFGTGAGLPGIPLALAHPEIGFVLLDSANKKTTFLKHVILSLGIKNVEIVTGRIEEFRFAPGFATIVTRATTQVGMIIEKTSHLCARHGQILMMKGKGYTEELKGVSQSLESYPVMVPYLDEERYVVIFRPNETY